MLVTLRNSRTLHHPRRTLLHPAIAHHRHAARRAIPSWHQLPSCSPAKFAIFQRHIVFVCVGPGLSPAVFPTPDSIRAPTAHGKLSALGKLWKEPLVFPLKLNIDH